MTQNDTPISLLGRIILVAAIYMAGCLPVLSLNLVEYTVSDSVFNSDTPVITDISWNTCPDASSLANENENSIPGKNPKIFTRNLSRIKEWHLESENPRSWVALEVTVMSADIPFEVYKAEWVRHTDDGNDSIIIKQPLTSFSYHAQADEDSVPGIVWEFYIEFPYDTQIYQNDELLLNTDKGVLREYIYTETRLSNRLSNLKDDFDTEVKTSEKRFHRINLAVMVGLLVLAVAGAAIFIAVRRRYLRKCEEISRLSLLMSERSKGDLRLKAKVDALYGARMDTLNLLCNKYFEISDSEKLKISFYDEIEHHILSLKDNKSVAELENIVNEYLDDILIRIKEQIPDLPEKDLVFLTYLYAGFSLRAVCVFTDIKIKNFYNRRSRLKERILGSDAPDKDEFVARMGL